MCDHCLRTLEEQRTILDDLIGHERVTRRLYPGDTEADHSVRLAAAIRDMQQGPLQSALALSLAVQKLIALEQVTGVTH